MSLIDAMYYDLEHGHWRPDDSDDDYGFGDDYASAMWADEMATIQNEMQEQRERERWGHAPDSPDVVLSTPVKQTPANEIATGAEAEEAAKGDAEKSTPAPAPKKQQKAKPKQQKTSLLLSPRQMRLRHKLKTSSSSNPSPPTSPPRSTPSSRASHIKT